MARSDKILGASPVFWGALVAVAIGTALMKRAEGRALVKKLPPPDKESSKEVSDLHPQFQPLVHEWEKRMKAAGIEYAITSTYRNPAKQLDLYNQGKSTVKFSFHNAGLAFDYAVKLPGRGFIEINEQTPKDQVAEWVRLMTRAAEIGKGLGMKWGGDWSEKNKITGIGWDPFHLEWKPGGITLATVQSRQSSEGYGFPLVA